VYVVPLRIGGGTRLKILEALAMGKAVVSTSVGAEGLNLTAGDEIVIADEPTAFGDTVVQLMENKSMRRRLGENGRRRVEAEYDWRRIGEKLQGMYEAVVAGDSGTTGEMNNS
ncbi:MAG: glycosyltransferase, partial [Candidatus Poribacteria bacterium]|nr:glycosyltransferase [Candidatus Poribacteria bacterium]